MTTQLAIDIEPRAPLRSKPELFWLGFTPDMDWDTAQRLFEERYGYTPRIELRNGGALLVGPIEEAR